MFVLYLFSFFFFFNATATTEIYTLSLHDALPISVLTPSLVNQLLIGINYFNQTFDDVNHGFNMAALGLDRKSTRLNSSHITISYAVFCLKKKKKKTNKY